MNDREQKRLDRLIAARAHRFLEGAASFDAIDRELDSIDAEPLDKASLVRILNRAATLQAGVERRVAKPFGPTRGNIPRPRVGPVTLPAEDHAPPAGPITPPAPRPRTSQQVGRAGGTSQEDQEDLGTGTGRSSGLA